MAVLTALFLLQYRSNFGVILVTHIVILCLWHTNTHRNLEAVAKCIVPLAQICKAAEM